MLPLLGAAVGGAGQLIGGAIQNNRNRQNAEQQQQWNLEQWNRQNTRDDQLWNKQNAYNLNMWNMNNEYNSPQSQMARFAEAGLNPHLIYGKGTAGNASTPQSVAQRTQSIQGYSRPEARNITQGMDVFGKYQQFKATAAQTDNLEAQTKLADQQALATASQRFLNMLNAQHSSFDLQKKNALYQNSLDAAAANLAISQGEVSRQAGKLHGLNLDNRLKSGRLKQQPHQLSGLMLDNLNKQQQNRNMKQSYRAGEQNININATKHKGLQLDNLMKQLTSNQKKYGVTDKDHILWRMASQPSSRGKAGATAAQMLYNYLMNQYTK